MATDEEQIRRLMAKFCRLLDSRRFEEWSRLFVADGSLNGDRGPADILAGIKKRSLASNPELMRKHTFTNEIIEVDDGGMGATATSDLIQFDKTPGGAWTIKIGVYQDRFRKEQGEWLFETRNIDVDALS